MDVNQAGRNKGTHFHEARRFRVLHVAGIASVVIIFLGLTARLWGWPPVLGLDLGDQSWSMAILTACGFIIALTVLTLCSEWSIKRHRNESPDGGASESFRGHRWRLVSSLLISAICLLVTISFAIGLVGPGVPVGSPILTKRPPYFLNSRGERIPTSEREFRFVGTAVHVGWSLFNLLFVAIGLHILYFGKWPFTGSGAGQSTLGKNDQGVMSA